MREQFLHRMQVVYTECEYINMYDLSIVLSLYE